MLAGRMKLQLVAFLALSGGVATNIFFLQPQSWDRMAGRAALPAGEGRRMAAASADFVGDTGSIARASAAGKERKRAAVDAIALPTGATEITRAVQRELQSHGYATGAADGVAGPMTRAAIMAFEFDHGLPLRAAPSQQLLKSILLGAAAAPGRTSGSTGDQSAEAESVIRSVQDALAVLGYKPGRVNGRLTPETVGAIREFEIDQQLPESGRISAPLVARLARLVGADKLASAP